MICVGLSRPRLAHFGMTTQHYISDPDVIETAHAEGTTRAVQAMRKAHRLGKLDGGDYDAIVLACAGLKRLGFEHRIRARLDAPQWLPAPAQGAIAVECREDDIAMRELLAVLDDADTRVRVEAERAMNRALHGSCHVPVAAYARLDGEHLSLSGLVGSAADGRMVRAEAKGRGDAPECLGLEVADLLLAQGARELIDAAL